MSNITEKVAVAVTEHGISIRQLAEKADIPYMNLYNSLANRSRDRELRASELIAICKILGIDPMKLGE